MKKLLLIIALTAFSIGVKSQPNEIDSLLSEVGNSYYEQMKRDLYLKDSLINYRSKQMLNTLSGKPITDGQKAIKAQTKVEMLKLELDLEFYKQLVRRNKVIVKFKR